MNLLNIFKKKESVLLDENGLNKIVQNINKEFYEIANKITEDANNVVEELEEEYKVHYEKAQLLKEIGFNNSQLVKDVEAIEKRKKLAQAKSDHLKKMINIYPNYKYISESDLKKIILKYNMIIDETSKFTGYIPTNNLLDIKKFFKEYPDSKFTYVRKYKLQYSNDDAEIITKKDYEEYQNRIRYPSRISETNGKYIDDYEWRILLNDYEERKKREDYDYFAFKTKLYICAPAFEFNNDPKPLVDINKLRSKTNYDPIIAIKIINKNQEDGFVIITAWGEDLPYDPKIYKDEKEM